MYLRLKNFVKSYKKIILVIIALAIISTFIIGKYTSDHNLVSRVWMEYAQDIVREKKPTPPASARFYAYVTSVYYETLVATRDTNQASLATVEVINFFYPEKTASSSEVARSLSVENKELKEEGVAVVAKYKARHVQDQSQAVEPKRLNGNPYWVGEKPLEPSAASWQRWIIGSSTFAVIPPPAFKSKEYMEGLAQVKEAASMRTSLQGAAVNFWGGTPGTEAPAGIWQNRLYSMVREVNLTDTEYAYAQMVLAQSIADSFMECWKVKYTYWTKRPSMVDPSIDLAMNNPPFPSYLSGHSTISRTAAEVLSVLFPQHRAVWLRDAEEAKNSRLWAGIHFPYDNEVGANVGEQIAKVIISKINIEEIK